MALLFNPRREYNGLFDARIAELLQLAEPLDKLAPAILEKDSFLRFFPDMNSTSLQALRNRWASIDGAAPSGSWFSLDRVRAGVISPFGKFGDREDFRGLPLPEAMRLWRVRLEGVDFTGADLRGIRATGTTFEDCIFDEADLSSAVQLEVTFNDCSFVRTNLYGAAFGADGACYRRCVFDSAVFTGALFTRPEFFDCSFQSCKLRRIDFNMSRFERCRFSGKLHDVRFNGHFDDASLHQEFFGPAQPNRMTEVDFSEATFKYVAFDNDCDLSTVTPPADDWHVFLPDLGRALDCVESKLPTVDVPDIDYCAAIWMPILRDLASRQKMYIVSGHDFRRVGKDVGRAFFALFRECAR